MRRNAPFRRSNSRLAGASFLVERLGATTIAARWVRQGEIFGRLLADDVGRCLLGPMMLGRSQVVRHRSLEPAFVGSNPSAPANLQRCPTNFSLPIAR